MVPSKSMARSSTIADCYLALSRIALRPSYSAIPAGGRRSDAEVEGRLQRTTTSTRKSAWGKRSSKGDHPPPSFSITGRRSAWGRVSQVPHGLPAARNCTRDEGGPFEFGDQEPISSHRKLLRAKAVVVSVAETPRPDFGRHGRERRAQANRCRSVESGLGDVRSGGDPSSGISSGDALILPQRHPACRLRGSAIQT